MNDCSYDNGSGRVLERLFGAQPVAQNRTPVLNTMAAGLRQRAVENQPPNTKSQLFGFRLLTLAFCCRWEGTCRPTCSHSLAPHMVPELRRPLSVLYSVIYLGGDLILLTSLFELSITYSVQFVNYFFKFFATVKFCTLPLLSLM